MQQEDAELFLKAQMAMQIRCIIDIGKEVEVRFPDTGRRYTLNIDGEGLPVFTELFREHLKAILKPTPKERADALREVGRKWAEEYKSNASLFTKAVTLLGGRWTPGEYGENSSGELCVEGVFYDVKVDKMGTPVFAEPLRQYLLASVSDYYEKKRGEVVLKSVYVADWYKPSE